MRRRTPACGSELPHGPHPYEHDHWPDGSKMRRREEGPGYCAGWTAAEADLCDMLRQVHLVMAEKSPPDGSRKFRLEVTTAVVAGLAALHLPDGPYTRLEDVHGAELLCVIHPDAGHWRLAETTAVISGRARV